MNACIQSQFFYSFDEKPELENPKDYRAWL